MFAKILSLLAFFLLSPEVFGDDYVRFSRAVPTVEHRTSDLDYEVEVDGDFTDSPSDAVDVFVPVFLTGNPDHNIRGENHLASFETGSEARTETVVPIAVTITTTATTWELFVAAKEISGSNYRVIVNDGTAAAGNKNLILDLKSICDEDANLALDCTDFQANTDADTEDILLLISIGAQGTVDVGDSIDPASFDGIYLNLKMSSAFTVGVPSLNGVYKADKSLKIVYESLTVDEYGGKGVYQIDRGANLTDSVCATNRPVSAPFGNLAGGSFVKLDSAESVEEDIVPNLKNGNCYSIQFLQWDKYNFATLASHGLSNTPEKLKTVLEKKSCFLLTAGFGGGHFLVDYFRRFRDQTLSGFFLGKKFIEFYEWAAPKATDTILQTPLLAATIRGLAWVAYGTLEYAGIVLSVLGLLILTLMGGRRILLAR